jgi:hypothetical protein
VTPVVSWLAGQRHAAHDGASGGDPGVRNFANVRKLRGHAFLVLSPKSAKHTPGGFHEVDQPDQEDLRPPYR